jgi:hypothetical protein
MRPCDPAEFPFLHDLPRLIGKLHCENVMETALYSVAQGDLAFSGYQSLTCGLQVLLDTGSVVACVCCLLS